MKSWRKILFPFAVLYDAITRVRNYSYDHNPKKHTAFEQLPLLAVGNLSVGGTGKTPMIEYLIRLLQPEYRLATLSRGYKRKSTGFQLADANSTPEQLGDEPFQFHQKFPGLQVAVDANRVAGVQTLLAQTNSPEVILLDDAFQHRKIKAGYYILLTDYSNRYSNDYVLPAGDLREARKGAQRAHCIIVTKCPADLSETVRQKIIQELTPLPSQRVYFTCIGYDTKVYSKNGTTNWRLISHPDTTVVAGIAKPQPFFDHLKSISSKHLTFPDHHAFTPEDWQRMTSTAKGAPIITTEKDYVRLNHLAGDYPLYYLPIQTQFLADEAQFQADILTYVRQVRAKK